MKEMKKCTLKDFDIFKESDNKYVVVVTGRDGVRRNISHPHCETKRDALEVAREERDLLNEDLNE